MKKFKIVLSKVPQGSQLKVNQRVEMTTKEMEAADSAGYEYVMAAEYDAAIQATAAETATKNAATARVEAAIGRMRKRGVLGPKEDATTIQASAVSMELVTAGLGEQFLDAQQAKAGAASHNPNQRTVRASSSSEKDAESDTHIWRGAVSASEAAEGYIKASQPGTNLVQTGQWANAFSEGRASGICLKELVEAGGEDMILSRVIKGASSDPSVISGMMHDGIVRADYTDPNTQVGILNTGLVLMRNLGFLKNKLNFLRYITTDLRNEPVMFGQTVNTRYVVVPNVLTWVPGVGFTSDAATIATAGAGTNQSGIATQTTGTRTPSVPSTPDVQVVMNQFKGVEIDFPITTLAGTVRNLFAEQRGAQTYALAEHIHQKFLATLFASVWTGPVTSMSLGNFALPGMIKIKNRMTLSKIPDIGRYALMHSYYHDALLTDTNLLSAKAILALLNKDASAFESGEVPELFGVKPLESQLASYKTGVAVSPIIAPDGSTVDFQTPGVNQIGFAGNMSSALFVARVPQDFTATAAKLGIPATNAVEIITEPDSNLTVMVFKYVSNSTMNISVRMCLMYGFAQGDPRVGVVLAP